MTELPGTLWEVFSAHAQRIPQQLAICGTHTWTYQELLQRSAELAEAIGSRLGPGGLVALDAAGPTAGVVALLAAGRAGCAVLPLNQDSPAHHREMVLADSRPGLLLQEEADGALTVVELEHAGGAEPVGGDFHGVAYVLFTSGSTGRPKGVVVSQEALLARLQGLARVPGLAPGESMLAMTAMSFDISMAEMLLPLAVGGSVLAAPVEARLDPEVFERIVADHNPEVIQATPSFWRLALAWGWSGAADSRIWCGGEPMTRTLADGLVPVCKELWNVYGPTEATIWATAARVGPEGDISLGSPLPGTGVFIEPGDTAQDGSGELIIYGAGLAQGYLNQEELTRQKFVRLQTPEGLARCYRTGDRARYRADGTLEFLGRTDSQIKLRGYRIELGEIESVLEEHPQVREAVVLLRYADDPSRAQLAAFLAAPDDLTIRRLRTWMAGRLPTGLRPQWFSITSALPRTTAGKADRVRLAAMSHEVSDETLG
ncbi:amino acid adenylation domain-containing protein [Streptomyces sp. NPDC047042]|uniref:amino acid adenylation domain-containing protein n=1 Tax=Streptomyces sp. NPDC047042 TaxID=3154807 RepID=UPI0033D1A1D5